MDVEAAAVALRRAHLVRRGGRREREGRSEAPPPARPENYWRHRAGKRFDAASTSAKPAETAIAAAGQERGGAGNGATRRKQKDHCHGTRRLHEAGIPRGPEHAHDTGRRFNHGRTPHAPRPSGALRKGWG